MTKIEPHCIEWTKTGWANTFHSTPPEDADIKTKLYTEAQMRQRLVKALHCWMA